MKSQPRRVMPSAVWSASRSAIAPVSGRGEAVRLPLQQRLAIGLQDALLEPPVAGGIGKPVAFEQVGDGTGAGAHRYQLLPLARGFCRHRNADSLDLGVADRL